jgi:hypothetical protein
MYLYSILINLPVKSRSVHNNQSNKVTKETPQISKMKKKNYQVYRVKNVNHKSQIVKKKNQYNKKVKKKNNQSKSRKSHRLKAIKHRKNNLVCTKTPKVCNKHLNKSQIMKRLKVHNTNNLRS